MIEYVFFLLRMILYYLKTIANLILKWLSSKRILPIKYIENLYRYKCFALPFSIVV